MTTVQPVPEVTSADVERIIRRDFPADLFAKVHELLCKYGAEQWHREKPERVRLAVLKLAAGNVDRLREQIKIAKQDCREVIGPAEYPRHMECLMEDDMKFARLPAEKQSAIFETDYEQYQKWLRR